MDGGEEGEGGGARTLVAMTMGGEEGQARWRWGHALSGPVELEVPGRCQFQSSDRQLGQERGLGGDRKDEVNERRSVA